MVTLSIAEYWGQHVRHGGGQINHYFTEKDGNETLMPECYAITYKTKNSSILQALHFDQVNDCTLWNQVVTRLSAAYPALLFLVGGHRACFLINRETLFELRSHLRSDALPVTTIDFLRDSNPDLAGCKSGALS